MSGENFHWNELRRLDALNRYDVLDTPVEQEFDEIAQLASDICGTPIAVINFIGEKRQFFKAEVGLGVRETPFESSFCAKAILEDDFLIVPDATKDHRFDVNPLVTGEPHLRFYAGAVLKSADNLPIGTVCVLDYEPRSLTELQQRTLRVLARQVMAQLDLRLALRSEKNARKDADLGTSRYKAVFNSAIDYAIIVMDRDGLITDWNDGATKVLGWTPEEICGNDLSAFFTPEDRARGIPDLEMKKAVELGRAMDERWHLRKGGARFWGNGEMMPLRSEDGSLEGFVKIVRDRTEERLAEERQKVSLNASGGVGLWDWMLDTDLLHGDANFARMYGLDPEEVASGVTMEGYQRYVIPEDIAHLREKIRAVFEEGADFLAEYRLTLPGQATTWVECRGGLIGIVNGEPTRFSGTAVDITALKRTELQKQLLMEELSHRVKNTFSVVQAIASQTLRATAPDVAKAFRERVRALSQAHDVLLQTSWQSTEIHSLMDSVLRLEAEVGRFDVQGPALRINSKAALSLSLLLHEMATNAVKYGSLSVDGGSVAVRWTIADTNFRLSWREMGGPSAQSPTRNGFGSRLIGMGLNGTGEARLEYTEQGLYAEFDAPMASFGAE